MKSLKQVILVLLPYEFLLEQNQCIHPMMVEYVLLPYEFLLEQNTATADATPVDVLLP